MTPRISFEHQLEALNDNLVEMGQYVEKSIDQIFKALETMDIELAKEVMEGDDTVDDMEKGIEAQSLALITRQQPVARDLRMVSTALKVVTDMERIGDHAADIAEIIVRFEHADFYHLSKQVPKMIEATKKMVHDSLNAFIKRDVKAAGEIMKQDDIIDGLFDKIKTEIISLLQGGNQNADYCVDVLMIAKYLERIGDHAVNICEWTIFEEKGTIDNIRVL
ncbi:phosphate signaling complex protein PhoU [Velocimicrobium porci]|uniref:Phosphate-specific transport system accessory protein PhoU n=1 Tax=Velocimicrobium porci TaxID=2606634 RepID=A0A6L5XXL7_9FIRM|nr:phosphate signaling complex protein PhoU [Velocimicrobium porci]MSS63610.1 phosphate signaling complex protein PhoU [Velocimicrobium porci]